MQVIGIKLIAKLEYMSVKEASLLPLKLIMLEGKAFQHRI